MVYGGDFFIRKVVWNDLRLYLGLLFDTIINEKVQTVR